MNRRVVYGFEPTANLKSASKVGRSFGWGSGRQFGRIIDSSSDSVYLRFAARIGSASQIYQVRAQFKNQHRGRVGQIGRVAFYLRRGELRSEIR